MKRYTPPLIDVWVASCFFLLAQAEIWSGLVDGSKWVTVPTAFMFTLPLAWRRRYPLAVAVACASGVALRGLLGVDTSTGITETVALVLVLYSVGFYLGIERAVVGLVSTIALATPTAQTPASTTHRQRGR